MNDIVRILLVLVLGTAALIISQRAIKSLFSIYAWQSLALASIAFVFFLEDGMPGLLFIAILTLASKVVFIPIFLRRLLKALPIQRDVEFRYLTPVSSFMVGTAILFIVYRFFAAPAVALHFTRLLQLGAVAGVSLAMMGMMVIFSRRKVVTKIIGYLVMENGALLFSLFVAEMPFIIEVLIVVDLIMVIVLAAVLAFGIDSSIEAFHKRLSQIGLDFED
jgi:hydrogenase-4 component E